MSRVQTELHGNAVLMRGEKQHLGQASLVRDDMLVIEPGRAERHYCRDLWRCRELFRVLAWRHLGALQADSDQGGVGAHPAIFDDGSGAGAGAYWLAAYVKVQTRLTSREVIC